MNISRHLGYDKLIQITGQYMMAGFSISEIFISRAIAINADVTCTKMHWNI